MLSIGCFFCFRAIQCVVSRTSSSFLFVLYYLASVSPNSANGPKVLTPSLAEFVFRLTKLTKLTKLLENVHWNALLPIEIKRNHQIWPIPPKMSFLSSRIVSVSWL